MPMFAALRLPVPAAVVVSLAPVPCADINMGAAAASTAEGVMVSPLVWLSLISAFAGRRMCMGAVVTDAWATARCGGNALDQAATEALRVLLGLVLDDAEAKAAVEMLARLTREAGLEGAAGREVTVPPSCSNGAAMM